MSATANKPPQGEWSVGKLASPEYATQYAIYTDNSPNAIAVVRGENAKEHAEHLVDAVNAHCRLREALEECVTDDGARAMTDESRNAAAIARRRLGEINKVARAALNGRPRPETAKAPEALEVSEAQKQRREISAGTTLSQRLAQLMELKVGVPDKGGRPVIDISLKNGKEITLSLDVVTADFIEGISELEQNTWTIIPIDQILMVQFSE